VSVCLHQPCLSVRQHETTRVPLDEFVSKLIFLILFLYLLTALRLTPGGSSTVHIYTHKIHITTQKAALVGRLSGIQNESGQTKINDEITALNGLVANYFEYFLKLFR